MKKLLLYIISVLTFGICILNVQAGSCTDKEKARLKKEASKVKLVYNEEEGTVARSIPDLGEEKVDVSYYYFKINLSNLTNEMYVRIENDLNDDTFQVGYSETKNGFYSFDWGKIDQVVTFSYDVYGSINSNCFGEKLATGHLTTPRYNRLHKTTLCDGLSDYPACKKYITENVSQTVLAERIREYKSELEKQEKIEQQKKKKTNKYLIVGGVVAVIGVGVIIVIKKRKRKASLV